MRIFYILLSFLILLVFPCYTQDFKDYSQLDPAPYNPATDPNIDMYMGCWQDSEPYTTHGNLIERDILTRGNPDKPQTKGAVLAFVNRFTYAVLDTGKVTTSAKLEKEQEIIYIISGKGTITSGKKVKELFPGIAVLIPASLEFKIATKGGEPLTMYLVSEPVPDGFRPNKDILIRNENTIPISTSDVHWVGIVKQLFVTNDGLGTLESVLTCSFSPMTFFHPHSHDKSTEEVWAAILDDIYVLLGKQIRLQKAGTAYMIPPDSKTPHANFNVGDKTVKMFYFARYKDHEIRK